jgi:hypothetical protein
MITKLGLAREGLFYQQLAPILVESGHALVAKTLYANADIPSGRKLIIMEDLSSAIQAGYFFGPGSPHNWSKDLEALVARGGGVTAVEMSEKAFKIAAHLHATFWGSAELVKHAWLKGSDWVVGTGKESFDASQKQVLDMWAATKVDLCDTA